MCQSVLLSTGGAHHQFLTDDNVYATGLLTRSPDPGRLRNLRIVLDPEFWRILCQIRNIKYCAEPSVRELPEHEGSLQRGVNLRVMLCSPANAVNPQRHPAG
nr:MAG TPA: hypothetical protein [Caudoviricetes sp.]